MNENHIILITFNYCMQLQPLSHSIQLDSRLVNKIDEMAKAGVVSMKKIKHNLSTYLKNDLFQNSVLPCTKQRRFWPTRKEICQQYVNACIQEGGVSIFGENIKLSENLQALLTKRDNVLTTYSKLTGKKILTKNSQGLEVPEDEESRESNESFDVIKAYVRV